MIDELGRRFTDGRARAGAGRRTGPRRDARPAAQRPRLHDVGASRARPSGCSRAGPTRSGTWAARSARSAAARATGRSRSRRTAPSPTTPSSRKPDVDFGDTLAGDLGRRDFTVNAMAVRLPGREFEDPYGGVVDLAHRVLRTPGRPEDSFSDDPLRMMRAARFAAQLGFTVDPAVVDGDARDGRPDRDHLRRAGPRRAGQAGLRAVPPPRPDAARRDRAGRAGAARAARRWRSSATSTTGTRTSTSTR